MSIDLALRYLHDRARGLAGWLLALVFYCTLIVAFYPSIRDSEAYEAALDDYPEALKEFFGGETTFQLTTGPGFINAQLYSFMVPLLLSIIAIGAGAAIGSDQRSGLLDLVLANPVPRWRVVVERALAMAAIVVGLAVAVMASVVAVGAMVDLGIGVNELAAATVATVLIVLLHGFTALAVAAATGRRSLAVATATVVFAAGYLLQSLAGLVDAIEPYRVVSPYYHAVGTSPLFDGWAWANFGLLAGLCGAVLVVAVYSFERRDLV